MSEHTTDKHQASEARGEATLPPMTANRTGISPWVWAALSALVILALAVIFVLPTIVQEYELPFSKRSAAPPAAVAGGPVAPPVIAVSPFDEAQRARQRREAQDVLASLLEKQAELDGIGVQQWAQQEYQQALETARTGDGYYRNADFDQAVGSYRSSDQLLAGLLEQAPSVFATALAEAEQALERSDADTAVAQYRLALLLDGDSEPARTGLQRAEVLEEVEDLLHSADRQQREGALDEAQQLIQQAVALDARHERAQQMLQDNSGLIQEARFNRHMSEGFALLQNEQPDQAINAFQQALNVKPGAGQAEEAIRQTREQVTNNAIAEHRRQARLHEDNEQWQQAINEYSAALALDPNLVFAAEGKDYSERRLYLEQLLQHAIDNPERLAEQEVFEETLEVYQIGRGLEEAGPKLHEQLEQLEHLLAQAQQPVEIQILSDNATEVTVHRVGNLGRFESKQLSLPPGRYIAVGTRPGFRDVREEFTVGFGSETDSITISCYEQIAAVNRR